MKLRILLVIAFLLTVTGVKADYFSGLPYTITQPDGDTISCYVSGDEFFNWIHDKEGFTIIQAADGYFYYGENEGDKVVPSKFLVNSVDPESVGLIRWAKISKEEYQRKRDLMFEFERSGINPPSKAPHAGEMNNIVVYIRFADDTEFTTTRQVYDDKFNPSTGVALKSYFQEVSYNNITISSTHYPACAMTTNLSYQDLHNRNYFQPYNATTNPGGYNGDTERRIREHQLLVDAITWINANSPVSTLLNIDADSDGKVDNVCFIIKGGNDGWAELLWAHRWSLYSQYVYINSKRVYDYTFQPETQVGVRTLCHEMFHALGAPDLYHYTSNGVAPVSSWDLMENGSGHMTAYMKWKYSGYTWITTIPQITTSGTYTLNPLTSPTNNCYKIASPYTTYEYFVVEYRNKSGTFETNIPGSGLIVYRIDTRVTGNASGPPDEVYIYRPNGTTTANGSPSSAHFSSTVGRTSINDATNPSSFLQNGSAGGLNISNVTTAGATISFTVSFAGPCTPPTTQASGLSSSSITNTTMDLGWTRGNGTGGVLILAKSGSLVDASPVNGSTYTANSIFGSGSQLGTGNYVVYKGSGTSVNITALTEGTTYHFAIFEYNSSDNCYKSPALVGNAATFGYCSAGATSTSYEYISNVSIGTINQTSGRGTNGYQNFTSQTTNMQIGVNTSASISVTDYYSVDQILIWIDWNKDGDFADANENVYSSSGIGFTSPHTTTNFAAPAGASLGLTRMRIRLHDSGIGSNTSSCGTSTYGEVEDYSINVISACTPPTNSPTIGTITHPTCTVATGSVVLSGLPSTGIWTLIRTPGGTVTTGTGTSTTISGIPTGTYTYTVTNATGCTSGSSSNVVINSQPVQTPPSVGTITQTTCTLTTGSVVLSGLPSSGTWTLTRTPGGTITTGTGTSTTISGLLPGTYTYTVTNASGCTSVQSSNVIINAQPIPTAPVVGTISQTTCTTATGGVLLNGLPSSGTWTLTRSPGGTTTTGTGTSTTISGLAPGTYSYTVTNSFGCISVSSANIVINIQPTIPNIPIVGVITQPTCDVSTGSVELSDLPINGTWTLTKNPNGTNTTGTGTFSIQTGLQTGTYTYVVTNAAGCTSDTSATIIFNTPPRIPVPAQPITGLSTVCQGQDSVLYTVPPISFATTYVWTLPSGATVTSTIRNIYVDYSTTANSGTMTVKGNNECGDGASSTTKNITVNKLPTNAGAITGATVVCQGQNPVTYTIPTIGFATSYIWTTPTGSSGTSNTRSITLNYSSNAVSGYLTVFGRNTCGDGLPRTITIAVNPIYSTVENKTICEGDTLKWQGQNYTMAGTYDTSYQTKNACDSAYTLHLSVIPPNRTLQLKLFLEGLYAGGGLMNQAHNISEPQFVGNIADKLTVELHDTLLPNTVSYETSNADLKTDGTVSIAPLPCDISGYYYIVIKHRNSIETWSSMPVYFGTNAVTFYDFTSSASQAYGDNQTLFGNVYAIWGGDENQDGIVDGTDMAAVDNASKPPSLLGYFPEDVNGDGIVDGTDMAIVDNNSNPPTIHVQRPQ